MSWAKVCDGGVGVFSDGAASRLGCVSVVAGGGDGFGVEEPGDAGGLCVYVWGGAGAACA